MPAARRFARAGGANGFKFQALALELEREIRALYEPGQRFESELGLCSRFGLNRDTVRKAILQLTNRGILRRNGRSGTFVDN